MKSDLTVVVGGGAAGICAAISAARKGRPVVICERTQQLGKKILASGNGRCNLSNDSLDETHYNTAARPLVKSVFARFGKADILGLFNGLGLKTYTHDGRVFPVTNQAASVLSVLEIELKRLRVSIRYGFNCSGISVSGEGISVGSATGEQLECRKVILTAGGKAYPALGSDGSGYDLAGRLGHAVVDPVPSGVPLVVKDSLCHLLQGQRISATVKGVIEGQETQETKGELLFTKYGLSGTAILDSSREISIALNRTRAADVSVAVDLVPFMTSQELADELAGRKRSGLAADEMLVGILPNKLAAALRGLFETRSAMSVIESLKARRFKVTATRGWNEAEFTAGGIAVNEVLPGTLESRLRPGIHFAGEVLDVDGQRGGYNLAWAWASGWVAGATVQVARTS